MPDDRFFHPKLGHSVKVSALDNFQFRVWTTYILAADDFGVMKMAAVTIQAANVALEDVPQSEIVQALQALVDVGLVEKFDHQGRDYICQLDWQRFQKVRYPRESLNPVPPPSILERCDKATQVLFLRRIGEGRERDAVNTIADGFLPALGLSGTVTHQYRIGSSYIDLLICTEAADFIIEVKKWELHSGAVDQVKRYAHLYQKERPGRLVVPVLFGSKCGSFDFADAKRSGVTVVTFNSRLECRVQLPTDLWQFPRSFSVKLTVNLTDESCTQATAKGNGSRQEAKGKPPEPPLKFEDRAARRTDGVMAGALPRNHLHCADCSPNFAWCVPSAVHGKMKSSLVPRFAGDTGAVDTGLRDWYRTVWDGLPIEFVMGDAFKFWQVQFDARWANKPEAPKPSEQETLSALKAEIDRQNALVHRHA